MTVLTKADIRRGGKSGLHLQRDGEHVGLYQRSVQNRPARLDTVALRPIGIMPLQRGAFVKGVVFNLLEEVVVHNFGPDMWDTLIDNAQVSGDCTSLGNYSDEEIVQLVPFRRHHGMNQPR